MNQKQIIDDLKFCIETLGITDNNEINDLVETTEEIGVSIRYFFEEFVFIPEGDPSSVFRLHDQDYFNVKELKK